MRYESKQDADNSDLFWVSLATATGESVSSGCFILDKTGRAVVMELATPEAHRGQGYARTLLEAIGKGTEGALRVVSTDHATGYYHKLGYTEITPYVFEAA